MSRPGSLPATGTDSTTLFTVALLLSLSLHLLFFAWPALVQAPAAVVPARAFNVALIERPTRQAPSSPTSLLAQADSQASRHVAQPERKQGLPAGEPMVKPAPPARPPAPPAPRPTPLVRPEGRTTLAPSSINADSLLAQARALSATEAAPGERFAPQQSGPVRGVYGVNAHGVEWARYVEDWRLKVERVGKLNYPDEARRQGVFGSLQLNVVLAADGRLLSVDVARSSGHALLDDAAVRIVRMAAPFPPFPPALAAKFSSLQIARKWSFTSENELFSR